MTSDYRRIALKAGLKIIALAACAPTFRVARIPERLSTPQGRAPRTIGDYMGETPDVVDRDIRYLWNWPDAEKSLKRSLTFIDRRLSRLALPAGDVVEVGSYKGQCLERLCRTFGAKRCEGFDIYDYGAHPRKRILDIRAYDERRSIALGWNQTSKWSSNPRSKLAAHRYLARNIVPGGFLVEDNLDWMPHDVRIDGFRIVHEDGYFTILEKLRT